MNDRASQKSVRVFKFGGTSVQDAQAILKVTEIVRQNPNNLVVVLSAMGGVTDLLLGAATAAIAGELFAPKVEILRTRHLDAARTLLPAGNGLEVMAKYINAASDELTTICQSLAVIKEHTPRVLDAVASRGERLLARLFTAYAQAQGLDAVFIDATDVIQVERQYGTLFPDLVATTTNALAVIEPELARGRLVVCPGFIGRGPDGELVTLGRGGSDLSATVLAHCLNAASVTLYKEVDGLLTADPRHVPEARIVPEMHYREAAELAYYGAKVLHSRTIIPLLSAKIPLTVRSTFHPERAGTRIADDVPPGAYPVKALTAIVGQALVAIEGKGMMGVPGIAGRTFTALAQAGISVSMISQASSEASICFVVPQPEAKAATSALREAFRFEIDRQLIDEVRVMEGQAIIAVVGLGMKGTPGIAARVFAALGRSEANIEAIAQGSSELNISVALSETRVGPALQALHREFRLEKLHALPHQLDGDVRFAILGVGQIGRTLLKQMASQRGYFHDKMHIDLSCLALIDTSGIAKNPDGFSAAALQDLMLKKERGEPLNGRDAPRQVLVGLRGACAIDLWQLPVKRGVFVDLTAGNTAPLLKDALQAGWHVVVANKKPLAVPQAEYDDLLATARAKGVYLRYEATVGAGLPILDTLEKLQEAGDEILSILGCFSGTLGFLMTQLSDGERFSAAVAKAHALGFTEPDPREDLSGMDVARKALILARNLGCRLDLTDIAVEALFPPACSDDVPAKFLAKLTTLDGEWAAKIAAAKARGEELRYVARIEVTGGAQARVTVGIESLPKESPLGRLKGTDNQVTITTRRYRTNPLIVTGPGAGAEVTAAGVLNDILAIATAQEPR